jgi:hypothetical protein
VLSAPLPNLVHQPVDLTLSQPPRSSRSDPYSVAIATGYALGHHSAKVASCCLQGVTCPTPRVLKHAAALPAKPAVQAKLQFLDSRTLPMPDNSRTSPPALGAFIALASFSSRPADLVQTSAIWTSGSRGRLISCGSIECLSRQHLRRPRWHCRRAATNICASGCRDGRRCRWSRPTRCSGRSRT